MLLQGYSTRKDIGTSPSSLLLSKTCSNLAGRTRLQQSPKNRLFFASGKNDVKAFLTHLAINEKISVSTQNQAFNTLLLFFREVLHTELQDMAKTVRAKRGRKLPTVLSVQKVQLLLNKVEPGYQLMVKLLYGSGLWLMELLKLRVKDIDFDSGLITVRSGKGDKDRTTLLPESLRDELRKQIE